MSESQQSTPVVVVDADELRATVVAALVAHGATEPDASTQADVLVEGELRGHPSHGVRRLLLLTERLDAGVTTSGLPPRTTWRAPGALLVSGRHGLGPVVCSRAIDALLERVHQQGVVVAGVHEAGHAGMLAPYVERLARHDCVGIALTISEPLVHAWGGSLPLVGTNPIAIGVPTAHEPLVLDMSTGATSAGRIRDYAARGQELSPGWAVDAAGHPTTDAVAAIDGAISPFGGAKGFALGVALEAVVGVLAGSAFGRDVTGTLDAEHLPTKGDLFIAISVTSMSGRRHLASLSAYLDEVRASGVEGRIGVPGDRSRKTRSDRLRSGIPLDAAVWAEVSELGGKIS